MATDYLKLAKEAFDSSTTYLDANLRVDLDYSIRAFRNEHAAGSKYLSDDYRQRSRIFRPKTRSIIRKNEAAAMQAAFSNRELVHTEAVNPNDVISVASAAALKEILQYRLTRTIPTFQVYLGGVQDAQTQGLVCSYQYWEYEMRDGRKIKDQPCIELRPLENLRLDWASSWMDPVHTSPYFCDIIPMYVVDVQAMMDNEDEKTGAPKWKKYDEKEIAKARPTRMDSSRKARIGQKEDPEDESTGITAFDTVWVMRWFMRDSQNGDKVFYSLGVENLLTEAKPIEEVYFHGKRPYVIGYSVLETHKALKTSIPTLVRPLQLETTEIANQRLDNVKFVLNKRWLVARGRQVDVNSLVRNVPGAVTLVTDPKNDVQESNWADVTSSAYVEQDRLNADFDDLVGNFSPNTKVANQGMNDTLGGSRLAMAGAGLMSDYLIRTINETWWEPVLRQVALLEQYYETDDVVLAVCAQSAKLFPRYGISKITDELLMKEVFVNVDMAMGDPLSRMQRFLMATNAAIQLVTQAPPGANVQEMIKEIYSNAGYREGSRFFGQQADPRLLKAMQAIQQLQGMVKGKQMELQAGLQETQMKAQSAEKIKGAELMVDRQRIMGDLQIRQQELELKKIQLTLEAQSEQAKAAMQQGTMSAEQRQAEMKLEAERQKLIAQAAKTQAELEKARMSIVGETIALHGEAIKAQAAIAMPKKATAHAISSLAGSANSMNLADLQAASLWLDQQVSQHEKEGARIAALCA